MRATLGLALVAGLGPWGALGGCGGDDSKDSAFQADAGGGDVVQESAPEYDSVTVDPPSATLKVPLAGSAMQSYKAVATKGGQQIDVTASCRWSLADPSFGAIAGSTLTAAPRGGETRVVANCSGVIGTSALTLVLVGSVVSGGAPANADSLFSSAQPGSDPSRTPAIEYPLDRAVAPLNVPPIDTQWTIAQNDLFHLRWASKHVALDVYTAQADMAFDAPTWATIALSTAGDDIAVTVEGLVATQPSTKYASQPVTVTMSHDMIDNTAIYYWASSKGDLMTQTFGVTDPPSAVRGDCTSCHSVSRSGSRIGYSRSGDGYLGFMHYDPTSKQWTDTMDANEKEFTGSFTTFSPVGNPFSDDTQSVALAAMASCNLQLFDPDKGKPVPSNVDVMSTHDNGNPGRCATMPDWSPGGETIVFASTPHQGDYVDLSNSAIATMSYAYTNNTHTFGEPALIVDQAITLPSGTYNNFFFPSFSPDGKYVVFNAARGSWRDSENAGAPGQRLMLTDPKGSWVIDLAGLNGPGDEDVTWPHWAPTSGSDYYWVVFSSEHDYGHKLTAANTSPTCVSNGVKQCKQIWIAAMDKAKLKGGSPPDDPSRPPVWMPGQDIDADNISPYWTVPTGTIPK
jgi:hypothetical protein